MKITTTLIAIAALTLITSARAQEEESASPAPATEEQSSATIEAPSGATESMPAATSEERAPALPSPAKKEEPAASASPAAAKKESSPASEAKMPAKKTAAAAVAGPDKGSPESNVKRLEQEWEMSIMKHDTSFAQGRIAEDFLGCSSKGKRLNKGGLMKEIKGDTDTYTSAKNGSVTVRAYGANVAVASGTSKEVGKSKDGKAFNRTYAWTDTWMLRGNRWQCIASQAMLLSGK